MKSAIIFGGAGQDGFYLEQILQREGVTVHSFSRDDCDVGYYVYVENKVRSLKPDYVFHLAAKSTVSHEALRPNQLAIVNGTLNILSAVHKYAPHCRVFLSGSILQFEPSLEPLTVHGKRSYASPYAVQRHASTDMGRYYRTLGLKIYTGYFSYHDSPRRSEKHLVKRLLTLARNDGQVENPWDTKEWNFAGDMMEAVWILVNQDVLFETMLGSGAAHSVASFYLACRDALGKNSLWQWRETRKPTTCCVDATPMKTLGWKPRISMEQLARMLVTPC